MSKESPVFPYQYPYVSAAVAKTATEDIPDQDAVQIHIRWPWKGTKSDVVDLFPADRYITFMERLAGVISGKRKLLGGRKNIERKNHTEDGS